MKRFFLFFLWISINAFSQEEPLQYVDFFAINDINFSVFDNPKYSKTYQEAGNKQQFLKQYFKVWNEKKQSISNEEYNESFIYKISKSSPCIGENYNPLSNKIINEISSNLQIDKNDIGKKIQLGITVKTANIRLLPTDEFCFKNVRNAGEGYPFDYFQNSTLWVATPVAILATSNNGLWHFINSHNNKGWVKASEIAFINQKTASELQKLAFFTPVHDKVIIKNKQENTKVYIGSLFPALIKNKSIKILIPRKGHLNNVEFEHISVSNNNFKQFPIKFNKKNVKHILTELHQHKYTWGGLNKGRDCSSTLKDFYTPFGLWLPRNSKQQKIVGNEIKLTGSNQEKLTKILDNGIPFLSTIYKPGHIVMYLGLSKNNTPIIFQNVWGIKAYYKNRKLFKLANKKEQYGLFGVHNKKRITNTRFIIGKAVITNIEPSKRLNKFKGLTTESFLTNFNTLTLLTR